MVALDAPGTLALFVGMTEEREPEERKKIVRQSIATAFVVTLGFMLLGRAIFQALGIVVEDFMIAGGLVLLIIAINDILQAGEKKLSQGEFGVVPLGTPIIAGPAMLTASLVLVGNYGYLPVVVSLIANLAIAWLLFSQSERIIAVIGISGSRGFAKVMALILAAFAVTMIRSGVLRIVQQH